MPVITKMTLSFTETEIMTKQTIAAKECNVFFTLSKRILRFKRDNNFRLLTDLFTRVKIRDKAFDVATLYDKYDVVSEKPEDVAYKHFVMHNIIGNIINKQYN